MSQTVQVNSNGNPICGMLSYSQYSFMDARFHCSLDEGHEDQHIAYEFHEITGKGDHVCWLGPWADKRPYEGPETDRLKKEWEERDFDALLEEALRKHAH